MLPGAKMPSLRTRTAVAAARATTTPPTALELPRPPPPLVLGAVEALFRIQPLFDAATRRARATIVDRAAAIGLDWESEKRLLCDAVADWPAAVDAVRRERQGGSAGAAGAGGAGAGLYPSYYEMPFHAYKDGNLSLDAAFEVGVAAAAVHATVFAPPSGGAAAAGSLPDPRGDQRLRESYMAAALGLLRELEAEGLLSFAVPAPSGSGGGGKSGGDSAGQPPPLRAVDFGAATGLSSLALAEALGPSAEVTGVDLSPHFVAVGRVEMARRRQRAAGERLMGGAADAAAAAAAPAAPASPASPPPAAARVALMHAAIEDTGLPPASFDLVSMCLVAHELPRQASRDALREAKRLLKPGGALCLMDMDPSSAAFRRIYASPFALAAFKSTEPWLTEYVALDALREVADAGLEGRSVRAAACSPRHRVIVASAPMGYRATP